MFGTLAHNQNQHHRHSNTYHLNLSYRIVPFAVALDKLLDHCHWSPPPFQNTIHCLWSHVHIVSNSSSSSVVVVHIWFWLRLGVSSHCSPAIRNEKRPPPHTSSDDPITRTTDSGGISTSTQDRMQASMKKVHKMKWFALIFSNGMAVPQCPFCKSKWTTITIKHHPIRRPPFTDSSENGRNVRSTTIHEKCFAQPRISSFYEVSADCGNMQHLGFVFISVGRVRNGIIRIKNSAHRGFVDHGEQETVTSGRSKKYSITMDRGIKVWQMTFAFH